LRFFAIFFFNLVSNHQANAQKRTTGVHCTPG
jgi:hypothetical protein